MTNQPLAIVGSGMVTGVGLSALASCAAIRCAIDDFQETRFMDAGGEWIMGCEVPLEQHWRGKIKLIKMAAMALKECLLGQIKVIPQATPMLLCLSEPERKGRVIDDDNQFFLDLEKELEMQFHPSSRVIASGHVSVAIAMKQARKLIYEKQFEQVLIVATDSLLVGATLAHYEEHERLLTSNNSNGFIAGEAGAALVVERVKAGSKPQLICLGIGTGIEKATEDSELPLRADGLVQAVKGALTEAQCDIQYLDFRITDVSGGQYKFKEAALLISRFLRYKKEIFDIWTPTDCIGEVGAAIGVTMLAICLTATRKGYTPGNNILCHLGNNDEKRTAMMLSYKIAGVT